MLLVPWNWKTGTVGNRILVAWKNSREAIQAIRGALAFLQQAEKVLVLAAADDEHADPPGSDIVAYLEHHGIAAEVIGTAEKGGKKILQVCEQNECDMIVMGVRAHFRLRELFLGGATDYIMRHATVPVLVRH